MDRVLDICPTCIRSKQTKNAAGGNSTRTAEQPYQGLSIDFSFSGTRSKNTFNRFPIGTKVKKKFGDKTFKGKVVRNPEDATERDPNVADFGGTTQSWRIEHEDQEQEDCNEREMELIACGNFLVLTLTSIGMTTALVSMEKLPGSLSLITSLE